MTEIEAKEEARKRYPVGTKISNWNLDINKIQPETFTVDESVHLNWDNSNKILYITTADSGGSQRTIYKEDSTIKWADTITEEPNYQIF